MDAPQRHTSRRRFLGFGLALAGTAAAGAGGLATFLWPRGGGVDQDHVVFDPDSLPAPGAEPVAVSGKSAWIVNLPAGSDAQAPAAPLSPGGYLALSRRCTCHPIYRGCIVPWLPDYEFRGVQGWFRCPCHGSVWSLSGARVKGPTATALEVYPAWVDTEGRLHVDFTAPSLAPANTLAVAKRRT